MPPEFAASVREALAVSRSFRLPTGKLTFSLAVMLRIFWIALFLAVTVGLLG